MVGEMRLEAKRPSWEGVSLVVAIVVRKWRQGV